MINIRCVHDLVLATTIATTGRFGYFELVFFDGGDVLSLKAPTLECAEQWLENLVARQQMFVKHAPTNDHKKIRRGTYLDRAVKDVVHAVRHGAEGTVLLFLWAYCLLSGTIACCA